MADPSWSKHVADILRRNDIRTYATVPDYIVSHVLEHLWADERCRVVTVTREEEAELERAWDRVLGEEGPLVVVVKVAKGPSENRLDRDVIGAARRFMHALAGG
ncbi:MAG: hypothetical protein HYR51_17680 [Candidatus Rokubacteria bacterium]|nr:hypothetical protein [Candidatus Rokubacteria bacterium]